MKILSITLLVIAGTALSCGFGRLALKWAYEVVIATTAIVTFGVSGLGLLGFAGLGLNGVVLTLVAAIMLPFIFVRFNAIEPSDGNNDSIPLGLIYWVALLVIFTWAGFKAWNISEYIRMVYIPELPEAFGTHVQFFTFTLSLFVAIGGFSMLMFFREIKHRARLPH